MRLSRACWHREPSRRPNACGSLACSPVPHVALSLCCVLIASTQIVDSFGQLIVTASWRPTAHRSPLAHRLPTLSAPRDRVSDSLRVKDSLPESQLERPWP